MLFFADSEIIYRNKLNYYKLFYCKAIIDFMPFEQSYTLTLF